MAMIARHARRLLASPRQNTPTTEEENTMGLLDGKVAAVTGSGRGIGRGIALELAKEGAKVVINDAGVDVNGRGSDADPATQVVKEIEAGGGKAVANYGDVSKWGQAEGVIQDAVKNFGTIDILVNNAGILRDKSLLKMEEDDFDAVIAVHLKGTFLCTRHAGPIMKEKGYGRIINITSSAGLRGNFGQTNYSAAKAGIAGMTLTWAIELGKYGITVNAMAPSAVTRMTTGLLPGMEDKIPPEMVAKNFDTVLANFMTTPGMDIKIKKPGEGEEKK